MAEPTLFWIIGDNTNVGKTTISCAMLRVLNQHNIPALGMKPYSMARFVDAVDLVHDFYPLTTARVFGKDAIQLVKASPLTVLSDIELVQPVCFVSYPEFKQPLLVRSGAQQLGNIKLYRTESIRQFTNRPNFEFYLDKMDQIDGLTPIQIDAVQYARESIQHHAQVETGYKALCSSHPLKAIVCEGSGHFAPFWNAEHLPDHLIYIRQNEIFLWPGVELTASFSPMQLPTSKDILDQTANQPVLAARLPIAPAQQRATTAEKTMKLLLGKAKILE